MIITNAQKNGVSEQLLTKIYDFPSIKCNTSLRKNPQTFQSNFHSVYENPVAINKILEKYSRKAQLDYIVTPQMARHTFCSNLIKEGKAVSKTVAILSAILLWIRCMCDFKC